MFRRMMNRVLQKKSLFKEGAANWQETEPRGEKLPRKTAGIMGLLPG